jgi:hypothetical protein
MEAGAMRAHIGSQWQAGSEFKMGPACVGGVAFLDEPALVTEIRPDNASFQRTQVEHYLDCIKSIDLALAIPIANASASKRRFLRQIKTETIRKLTHAFLGNTITIRATGQLDMCGSENMARPVTFRQVLPVYARRLIVPSERCARLLYHAGFRPRAKILKEITPLEDGLRSRPIFARATATGRGRPHGG